MSPVVLDTHTLVWLLEGATHLGWQARDLVDGGLREEAVLVSAISFWEVAMLGQRHRLEMGQPAAMWRQKVLELGILEVPVSGDIGILATELTDFPADPADRMITATAMVRGGILVTADNGILGWQGRLDRQDARQ